MEYDRMGEVERRIAEWGACVYNIANKYNLLCEERSSTTFLLRYYDTNEIISIIQVDKTEARTVRYSAFGPDNWVEINAHAELENQVVTDIRLIKSSQARSPPTRHEISFEPRPIRSGFAVLNHSLDRILGHL